ncbi:hypothetical protein WJ32_00105 [Burkholderia ubonensis]|uniref:Uncharacterized protein n=1 Tax=Burkholderia ubonensis TaxID=101571 RepID=A0A103R6N4_9BURK|nr:hypothetical protein WJ32_00105 [Burkholderia ubonensis]KVG62114.1 hypothetical protein WJ33_30350 [Burkholderia ubonensis]
MKWRIAQIAHDVHIGAGINQHFHIVNGALARGEMQERIIHGPTLIWIGQFKSKEFGMGFVLLKNRFQLLIRGHFCVHFLSWSSCRF